MDYGLGNVRAFANIFKNLDVAHRIAVAPGDLDGATSAILPGVGAFDRAMERLTGSGMRERLDDMVLREKLPVLGVCVGMHMMARSSEEGRLPGLGWIEGDVKKLDTSLLPHVPDLPHMGWNDIKPCRESRLLSGFDGNPTFYFLHSYYLSCEKEEDIVGTTEYGQIFPSVVSSGNVHGIQCHPEKSHWQGIRLLASFAELIPD